MGFLNENMDRDLVPMGAVVGGANDEQQQGGCVALMDAGDSKQELYAPLLWKRIQVRAMGPSLAEADDIGNHLFDLLNGQQWLEMTDSRGWVWFCHQIYVAAGTSHHIDSSETWESLLFVNVTLSRDPVSVPG
jgi:hypothetical protein